MGDLIEWEPGIVVPLEAIHTEMGVFVPLRRRWWQFWKPRIEWVNIPCELESEE